MNRRMFLRRVIAGGTGVLVLNGNASARGYRANEKLNLALVGVGGLGEWFVDTIARVEPAPAEPFEAASRPSQPLHLKAEFVERHRFEGEGRAAQGVALTGRYYYSANEASICQFDRKWRLIEEKPIKIEGVNHLGAIDYHDGHIWGGLLHGPEGGKYDPAQNRSVIARIRASDLSIEKTWDITRDVKWIDPVCFDGKCLWVGDMSDLGIHRYRLQSGELVRDGVLRYPKEMGFSQGIRIVAGKLYTIHIFGTMSGLFEFVLPERLSDEVQQPRRVWDVKTTTGHLEGFDFVPGCPNQIWHAQNSEVDRYVLQGFPEAAEPAGHGSNTKPE